jgi:hypothetical protein
MRSTPDQVAELYERVRKLAMDGPAKHGPVKPLPHRHKHMEGAGKLTLKWHEDKKLFLPEGCE